MVSTSSSLLARIKVLDKEAWDKFVTLYGPMVFGWCSRNLTREDADDTTQEVFQSVWTGISSYDPDRGRFRDWLGGITRNRVIDLFRTRGGEPAGRGGDANIQRLHDVPDDWDREDQEEVKTEERQLVHRGLELVRTEFEERTWLACLRTAVDEQSASSVAEELGMTRDAVYQAKSRVLKRLREELDGLF